MEEHPQARQIVETLAKAGFIAYYAGGWVRDFILGHPSDDIDIATNAPPETVQALFPKTIPLGISFGIILVLIDGNEYEVATFRTDLDYRDGRRPSRIEYATPAEDAKRRDFTINGMFYDPLKEEILDFVGGRKDLELKLIRAIGNPHERIKEDRLRMIRAIRLACRFHFIIDPATEQAIRDHAQELFPAVAIERVVQEFKKGLAFGKLHPMLIQLHQFGLLAAIFPTLETISVQEIEKRVEPIHFFPKDTFLIGYLLQLFPKLSIQKRIDLCKLLKLPNSEQQFAIFLFHAEEISPANRPIELIEWAYFYANRFSTSALRILAARLDPKRRTAFLTEHEERIALLQKSIDRIHAHNPIVQSKDLVENGILPGRTMGLLLKEAEKIAINQQIHDKDQILTLLQQTPIWPK